MSSIYKRGNFYQIAFTKRVAGKSVSKRFSLGVKSKRRAQKKQIEYDELYEAGKIDPFNGWSVKDHERDKTPSYVTLGKLIEEFHAKNTHKADATIKNYKYILEDFKKGVGDSMPVSAITDQHVRDFCFRGSLAPASQANYLRHLKVFFSWLEKEGYTQSDVTQKIKKPKFSKNIADKTITQEERDRIFQAFDKDMAKKKSLGYIHNDFQARIWFKPLINTVFYTGLRRSEVVKLKWRQIDLDKGTIVVAGKTKGHKERAIPLRKELLPILKQWKEKSGKESGFVFPSRKKGCEGNKMSGPNISRTYKKYVRLAGIKSSANFHGLRHTCGTEMLRSYYDINGVAKVLGHSDLKVTQEYDHLNTEDLVDKMRQYEGEQDELERLRSENEELKARLEAIEN